MDLYINSNPDIILLDITMPYYTGLELMEMIKDENPENDYLPILILTARHFIAKPVDVNKFLNLIDNYLTLNEK